MDRAGDNAHDIFRKTGIQPSTIYRYFSNPRSDLKPETTKKLARIYGVTESQLRGDVPIDGMDTPPEQLELKDLLTLDDYRLVKNIQFMDDESRGILYRLAEMLAEPQAEYSSDPCDRRHGDRRKNNVYPNAQLRISDELYNSPPVQRRLKNADHRRKYIGSKNSQTA